MTRILRNRQRFTVRQPPISLCNLIQWNAIHKENETVIPRTQNWLQNMQWTEWSRAIVYYVQWKWSLLVISLPRKQRCQHVANSHANMSECTIICSRMTRCWKMNFPRNRYDSCCDRQAWMAWWWWWCWWQTEINLILNARQTLMVCMHTVYYSKTVRQQCTAHCSWVRPHAEWSAQKLV